MRKIVEQARQECVERVAKRMRRAIIDVSVNRGGPDLMMETIKIAGDPTKEPIPNLQVLDFLDSKYPGAGEEVFLRAGQIQRIENKQETEKHTRRDVLKKIFRK